MYGRPTTTGLRVDRLGHGQDIQGGDGSAARNDREREMSGGKERGRVFCLLRGLGLEYNKLY